jgi:hypothetical protein
MAVQLVANRESEREKVSPEEWAARVELAAGHAYWRITASTT